MTARELPPCDCLNWCGDDPWLEKGKADRCAEWKEKEAARRAKESQVAGRADELRLLRDLELKVRIYAWNPSREMSTGTLREFNKLLASIETARITGGVTP